MISAIVALLIGLSVCALLSFAVFVGGCIRGAQETPAFKAAVKLEPEDLDDWLAAEGPLLEFKVWKRPQSEVRVDRGVVS